jgi:hypothetical protein
VKVHVSDDFGKKWRHFKDLDITAQDVALTAPKDGVYWFAIQAESKEGLLDPLTTKDLKPAMKVWVNSERKSLKPNSETADLHGEVARLREIVEQQRKRITDLESKDRKEPSDAWVITIEIRFK